MLPAHTLQALDASQLPAVQETIADVLDYEFRYSEPSVMAQVCTGGAVCGNGWDIAVLRVRQLCPRQRCVPPLPLSLGTLQAGDSLRLMGVGSGAPSAPSPRPADDAGYALRYHDGTLAAVHANQSLTLTASASAAALGEPGPVACVGDAGAPVLRYESSLENTTELGAVADIYGDDTKGSVGFMTRTDGSSGEGEQYVEGGRPTGSAGLRLLSRGGWAVVGVHSAVGADATCPSVGRAWLTRVSRCWLWRVLGLWSMLPAAASAEAIAASSLAAAPGGGGAPAVSPDTVQWTLRAGVRRLTASVQSECAGSDHWPPELRSPSHPLPPHYARELSGPDDDEAVLPTLPPVTRPVSAAVCYGSPRHLCVHLLRERGRLRYSIDDGTGAVVGRPLTMARLARYTFQMVGVHPVHAMVISDSETGPDQRRLDEVTGDYPASDYGVFVFTPTLSTPATVYFQSVSRSGVGGAIHIENTPSAEPRSLPGGVGAPPLTPSTLLFWDAHGATLHRWRDSNAGVGAGAGAGAGAGGAAVGGSPHYVLDPVGHLPLAAHARSALFNRSYAAWRRAYAARMALAPVVPNATYVNVTNTTNTTLVYTRHGVVVNSSNVTDEWLAFEKTLPEAEIVPRQRVTAAVLEPRTSDVYWSTHGGHLLTAKLSVKRDEGGGTANATTDFGRVAELGLSGVRLLLVGNESGTEPSPWRVGLASSAELHYLVYHNAFDSMTLVDTRTMTTDDGESAAA